MTNVLFPFGFVMVWYTFFFSFAIVVERSRSKGPFSPIIKDLEMYACRRPNEGFTLSIERRLRKKRTHFARNILKWAAKGWHGNVDKPGGNVYFSYFPFYKKIKRKQKNKPKAGKEKAWLTNICPTNPFAFVVFPIWIFSVGARGLLALNDSIPFNVFVLCCVLHHFRVETVT